MQPRIHLILCLLLLVSPVFSFITYSMNNDGNVDILWHNASAGANEVWTLEPIVNSTAARKIVPLINSAAGWKMIATADFNGDSWILCGTTQPPASPGLAISLTGT